MEMEAVTVEYLVERNSIGEARGTWGNVKINEKFPQHIEKNDGDELKFRFGK